MFLLGDIIEFDLVELGVEIIDDIATLLLGILPCESLLIMKHIVSDIINREDLITAVDCLVDKATDISCGSIIIGEISELVEFGVNARGELEMNFSFKLEEACFHAEEVVMLRLFETRVTTFHQELASLEIIVGIELVRDRHRHKVDFLKAVDERAFAGDGEHLDERLLCMVGTILSPTLTLGNPYRLLLIEDGMVDICAELLGGKEPLAQTGVALHDERLIESHQVIDPIEDQEVIADSHLRRGDTLAHQCQIEKRGIEHDVAVVGDIHIIDSRIVELYTTEADARSSGLGEHLEEWTHNLILKIILIVDLQKIFDQSRHIILGHGIVNGM